MPYFSPSNLKLHLLVQNCKACLIRSGVWLFQHSLSIQFSWCPYDIFQNGKNWWSERLRNERYPLIPASLNLLERVIRFSRPFLRFLAFLPRISSHISSCSALTRGFFFLSFLSLFRGLLGSRNSQLLKPILTLDAQLQFTTCDFSTLCMSFGVLPKPMTD